MVGLILHYGTMAQRCTNSGYVFEKLMPGHVVEHVRHLLGWSLNGGNGAAGARRRARMSLVASN